MFSPDKVPLSSPQFALYLPKVSNPITSVKWASFNDDVEPLPDDETSHAKLAIFCQVVSILDTCNFQSMMNQFELLNTNIIENHPR